MHTRRVPAAPRIAGTADTPKYWQDWFMSQSNLDPECLALVGET